ncbi:MAG: S41 family peptidase, partial [Patescibacteria group bacterium]
ASQPDYEKGRKMFQKFFLLFFCLFLLGISFWAGFNQGKEAETAGTTSNEILSPKEAIIINKDNQDKTIDFALFWKVWTILNDKFVDKAKLDAHTLFYGAIDGMLAATGDPYTTFFDPEENKKFKEEISGTFEGIGAEMAIKDGVLTVVAPLEGTPSEKAGVRAGDKVLKINDESTANMSIEEAVSHIRGPKGTEVRLNIYREGDDEAHDVVVKRDVIFVESVRYEKKENNIALIRVSRFGEDTEGAFRIAAKRAVDEHVSGIVLDLRNNPGGFLDTSIEMASLMLPSGSVVVQEENSKGDRKEMKATDGNILGDIPTVVLINEGSASASEILAAALRDNRSNVTLVGKKSFGKGSVQELIAVSKDTSVKVTVARWLTPKGDQINEVGISPKVEVPFTREDSENDRDPQMDKALELLKK